MTCTSIVTNLIIIHPRNIHTKCEANQCSDLREVDYVKQVHGNGVKIIHWVWMDIHWVWMIIHWLWMKIVYFSRLFPLYSRIIASFDRIPVKYINLNIRFELWILYFSFTQSNRINNKQKSQVAVCLSHSNLLQITCFQLNKLLVNHNI